MAEGNEFGVIPEASSAADAATPKRATPDLRRCLECGLLAKSVDGRKVYPHRPDLYSRRFWVCQCGAYVGSHKDSGEPLGHPVGPEGRKVSARIAGLYARPSPVVDQEGNQGLGSSQGTTPSPFADTGAST